MELIRGIHNLREQHRSCVLTLGNFDGVHRGHQALLASAHEQARKLGLPMTVMTFEPTPREYFARLSTDASAMPGRISPLRDRLRWLEEQGVERLLLQGFHRRFAQLSAPDFIEQILVQKLAVRAVVIGDDFRFGCRRAGDLKLLQQYGQRLGFSVANLSTLEHAGQRCSSTAVRAALAQPDLALAQNLLGRRYSLSGRVRRGLQLGRKLNMPTANIPLRHPPALRLGVYAVRARLAGRWWPGVASLGLRPTLNLKEHLLETHFFNSPGDIYGQILEVEFAHFLRPEERFESLNLLALQMQADKTQAMALLGVKAA